MELVSCASCVDPDRKLLWPVGLIRHRLARGLGPPIHRPSAIDGMHELTPWMQIHGLKN